MSIDPFLLAAIALVWLVIFASVIRVAAKNSGYIEIDDVVTGVIVATGAPGIAVLWIVGYFFKWLKVSRLLSIRIWEKKT